ncbi:preprotein translocase subunit YajC [Litorivicinus sp.]|jgi:preprotein translocase subunit YajC|nr:preprotein translocase subunit YajC [Litorivicinus sp.]|tara:strand:- start:2233 stop:2508 length:276 start_codon:yes stop_codon:yes gene_type:complete
MDISVSNPIIQIILVAAFIGLFYFLLLKPQQKRVQAHADLINSLEIGATIITVGGFFGKIIEINSDSVAIELAPEVVVKIEKSAVETLAST